jgi:predicted dienelactone hydrolase
MLARSLAACLLLLTACDDEPQRSQPADAEVSPPDAAIDAAIDASPVDSMTGLVAAPADARGPLPVARAVFAFESEGRTLPTELWYPTNSAAGAAEPVWSAFLTGDDAETYRDLIEAGRAHCATEQTTVPRDQPIVRTGLPLVVMSHCHVCTRFNMMTVAAYLASHGFIVAAPDHVGNTLFDGLRGESAPVGGDFLITRGADMRALVDVLLDGALDGTAGTVAAQIDPARIGVMGHSFGAVTAGWVLEHDPRVRAGVAVAAPMENPLVAGVTLAAITQPTLHVIAVEDNSITAFGNTLIRNNFAAIAAPTYKVEVDDAGHWSFSDLAGVTEGFAPGCGDDTRQTNQEPFSYLEPVDAVPILATYATAFFRAYLADDDAALALLAGEPAAGVSIEAR